MSVIDLVAEHLALKVMVERMLLDVRDQNDLEIAVMQELHEELNLLWDDAEKLASKLVEKLFDEAEEVTEKERRNQQECYDARQEVIMGVYYGRA